MEKLKLTVDSHEFHFTDYSKIVCTLCVSCNADYFIHAAYKDAKATNKINSCCTFNKKRKRLEIATEGVAKCMKGDTYDENIGKRIAYAKALKTALKLYRHIIEECVFAYSRKQIIMEENLLRMDYLVFDKEKNLINLRK